MDWEQEQQEQQEPIPMLVVIFMFRAQSFAEHCMLQSTVLGLGHVDWSDVSKLILVKGLGLKCV